MKSTREGVRALVCLAVETVLYFASGLYLVGLGVYVGAAVWSGSTVIKCDALMPCELLLIAGLATAQFRVMLKTFRRLWSKISRTPNTN